MIFFPGSTIGNFTRADAIDLLRVMRAEAKPGGGLVIGVDLIKNLSTVRRAYNDERGVTAEFNLNVLHHLNDGIGANFQPELFRHEAIYDTAHNRIEMRLISLARQEVEIGDESIEFAPGEHIVTEYSHKYSVDGFAELAARAGWSPERVWTDAEALFSVHFMTTA